jgi:uncharacterized repeat protein (TIGR03803 family)
VAMVETVAGACRIRRLRAGAVHEIGSIPDAGCGWAYPSPYGPLLAAGPGGHLYGVAHGSESPETSVVFHVSPNDTVTILRRFTDTASGLAIGWLALGADGALWGTTTDGGEYRAGTVFKMSAAGVILMSVPLPAGHPEGTDPAGPPLPAGNGVFYLAMSQGGPYGNGTILRTTRTGETRVLYHFIDKGDGAHPHALVRGPDGAIYGTTTTTVFRMAPSGALTTLFVFRRQEDGLTVSSPLTLGPGGFLYGTTSRGGRWGNGTAFRVGTDGAVSVIHHFDAIADHMGPTGPLLLGRDGKLYGRRLAPGNSYYPCSNIGPVCGVVYSMTDVGTVNIVFRLTLDNYGVGELKELAFVHPDGSLYGLTSFGAIFSLTTRGEFSVILRSSDSNWGWPLSLTRTRAGRTLLLATTWDGQSERDAIFSLTPQGAAVLLHQFEDHNTSGLSFVDGDDSWVYGTRAAYYWSPGLGSTFRMAVDAPKRPTGVRVVR